MPDATNVYLLDFSGLNGKKYRDKEMDSGLDVARWLLDEAGVTTVPGECSMFDKSTMLVRIALNHTPEQITKAFDNMILAAEKIYDQERKITSTPDNKSPDNSPEIQSSNVFRLVGGNEVDNSQSRYSYGQS